ncbi:hypothetical protein M408DRAFT_265270 [Serendipita vermifera MAFF 305830]|uniref:F-box domain-containing protein n=1 Tax=Serendipita vermifera MAFF 305830 TaxID=933852 RepID=A0A0C3AF41_SERVB|nr:hypothetical protein M408DRAFT_265270 [Serendipita vermifera MAFF 305830]
MALNRRPFLKNHIRVLKIFSSTSEYTGFPHFPMLSKVIFIQCPRCRSSWGDEILVASALRALYHCSNISEIELPMAIGDSLLRTSASHLSNLNSITVQGCLQMQGLDLLSRICKAPLLALDVWVSRREN